MSDNQREDGIIDLTADMTSTPPPGGSGAETAPAARASSVSSMPPQPVSPFQPLVSGDNPPPDEEEDKEDKTIFPVVEKKTSFAPKPAPVPVLIVPIQQVRHPSIPPTSGGKAVSSPSEAATIAASESIEAPAPASETANETHEGHDDDHILDLSDEMVADAPVAETPAPEPTPSAEPGAAAAPITSAPAPAAVLPVPSKPPEQKTAESDGRESTSLPQVDEEVFEARETTISISSLKGRGTYEEAKATDDIPNEILEAAEQFDASDTNDGIDIPVDTEDEEDSESVSALEAGESETEGFKDDQDDAEELDLSEAEEVPRTGPPAVPTERGDGRKPVIRRRRRQNKEWWARIFNDDYVSTIPKATVRGDQRKVNFIEKSLALASNALVLDLACGNGRHSVGMAKRGYRVVGIDLSLPMLAQAAELAQDERQNINFIHGDMRDLSFDKTFDAVFCMGTSFGYFDEAANTKVLQGVFRALKPGGSFLIEIANRDHVVSQTPELTWFEGNGSVCMEETSFNYRTSRLVVTRQLIMDGGRQVQNDISIRVYSLHEIEQLLQDAGFEIGTVSGHTATPGAFFGPDSVRIFVCAKRPRPVA